MVGHYLDRLEEVLNRHPDFVVTHEQQRGVPRSEANLCETRAGHRQDLFSDVAEFSLFESCQHAPRILDQLEQAARPVRPPNRVVALRERCGRRFVLSWYWMAPPVKARQETAGACRSRPEASRRSLGPG